VRRNDYVILAEKRAFRGRFFGENIEGGAGDFLLCDGLAAGLRQSGRAAQLIMRTEVSSARFLFP